MRRDAIRMETRTSIRNARRTDENVDQHCLSNYLSQKTETDKQEYVARRLNEVLRVIQLLAGRRTSTSKLKSKSPVST